MRGRLICALVYLVLAGLGSPLIAEDLHILDDRYPRLPRLEIVSDIDGLPTYEDMLFTIGMSYYENGYLQQAGRMFKVLAAGGEKASVDWYRDILNKEPLKPHNFTRANERVIERLHRALSFICLNEKYDEARAILLSLTDDQPGYAEPYHWLGLIEQMKGNFYQAVDYYDKYLQFNPLCNDTLLRHRYCEENM